MGYWAFIEGVRAPPTQRVAAFLFPQSPQESIPKARVGPGAPLGLLVSLFPGPWVLGTPLPSLLQLPWESPGICCGTPSSEPHLCFPQDRGELAGHAGIPRGREHFSGLQWMPTASRNVC